MQPAASPMTSEPTRQMIDSAFPLKGAPSGGWPEIILIYAGGDTVHPWTTAEILAMPSRYRWPTWVRSNPGQVNAGIDAALFSAWLHGHHVPQATCVILDLETAVDTAYVNTFNLALRAAGYRVTKYGSESSIWKNPKTDGGTFVAQPGPDVLTTEGDTVARQYAFDGAFDLSVVKGQAAVPLWDTAPPPAAHQRAVIRHTTGGALSLSVLAGNHGTTPAAVLRHTAQMSPGHLFPPPVAAWVNAVFAGKINVTDAMPAGLELWMNW